MARARLLVAAIGAALGIAAGTPAIAHAQQPCWKRVVADWAQDGVVSKQCAFDLGACKTSSTQTRIQGCR